MHYLIPSARANFTTVPFLTWPRRALYQHFRNVFLDLNIRNVILPRRTSSDRTRHELDYFDLRMCGDFRVGLLYPESKT